MAPTYKHSIFLPFSYSFGLIWITSKWTLKAKPLLRSFLPVIYIGSNIYFRRDCNIANLERTPSTIRLQSFILNLFMFS